MKVRNVEAALRKQGCAAREGSKHTVWTCSCGSGHKVAIPRHTEISAGVVKDGIAKMICLEKGWLQ